MLSSLGEVGGSFLVWFLGVLMDRGSYFFGMQRRIIFFVVELYIVPENGLEFGCQCGKVLFGGCFVVLCKEEICFDDC